MKIHANATKHFAQKGRARQRFISIVVLVPSVVVAAVGSILAPSRVVRLSIVMLAPSATDSDQHLADQHLECVALCA